jgi:ADP-ribose pyrophosphatase
MRREVYRGRVVDLGIERVTLPNGAEIELEVVRHAGAAAVAAVDDTLRVVLIHQYRHAGGGLLWEIPAGLVHEGEAPEACAQRELGEEVGLAAARLERLGTMLPTPGYSDERIHLFLGRGLTEAPLAHEGDEVIQRIERVPLADAVANLGRVALGVAGIATGRGELLRALTVDSLHEPYRATVYPELPRLIAAARDAGALGACLSGSGSTVIAFAGSVALLSRIEAAFTAVAADADLPGRVEIVAPRNKGATIVAEG